MRVLHITPAYYPSVGGIEKVVDQLATRLTAGGDVSDVAHVAPGLTYERTSHDEISVLRLPIIGHRLLGIAPSLRRIVAQYDLLHVHDPQLMAITANLALFANGYPAVLSTHGGYRHTGNLRGLKNMHERLVLRQALQFYRLVFATSKSDYDKFRQFTNRIVLAENGVETSRFSNILDQGRSVQRWIYWGRFSSNKRLESSIRLASAAVANGIQIDYLITGPDPDRLTSGLQSQINSAGLARYVRITPPLTDVDLDRELSSRGVYVTASEHEGFGLGVIEAMAAGLIVLCRDIAPLNGFVSDGATGFFFDFDGGAEDTFRLNRLLSLNESERSRISRAARKYSKRHSWDGAVERFRALYIKVLSEARSQGGGA